MKLVRWEFNGLHVPMMADKDGLLYCTSKQLCEALGITKQALHEVKRRHADEFSLLRSTESGPKEFLTENKVEFGIKRVKSDMVLWPEDDMILVAMLTRSSVSKEFRRQLVLHIKANAKKDMVPQVTHTNALIELGKMAVRLEEVERYLGFKDGPRKVELKIVNNH
jgi:prophage antirepressor-like protein